MHKLSFYQGESLVHRLYPVTKLFWLFLGTGLIFFLTNGYFLLLIEIIFFIILTLISPNIWRIRGFHLVLSTGIMLLILYLLFDKSDSIIIDPRLSVLKITTGGLNSGLRFSGRFLSIVFLSYIFILTTNPNHLAYALMKIGLPYRYGFMLVTALRLAPILEKEAQIIYRAQLVRGVQYDSGNLKKLFLLTQQFLTPLLITALRRADKLVFSMEGRGFGRSQERTFQNQTSPSLLDLWASLGLLIFFTALILIDNGALI